MMRPAGSARRLGWRRGVACLGAGGLRRIGLVVALVAASLGSYAWACGTNLRAQAPAEQVFDLHIEGGEVADDMRTLRVTQGDDVRLRWTADGPSVLHLHGYDIEKEVVPGRVTEFGFEAYASGRFPLEIHAHGDAPDQSHHGPLVVLEVYPR